MGKWSMRWKFLEALPSQSFLFPFSMLFSLSSPHPQDAHFGNSFWEKALCSPMSHSFTAVTVLGAVLFPRVHLATSGDIFGCCKWEMEHCSWHLVGRETSDAIQHPTQGRPLQQRLIWQLTSVQLRQRNPALLRSDSLRILN